jgi:hypothetical protein
MATEIALSPEDLIRNAFSRAFSIIIRTLVDCHYYQNRFQQGVQNVRFLCAGLLENRSGEQLANMSTQQVLSNRKKKKRISFQLFLNSWLV